MTGDDKSVEAALKAVEELIRVVIPGEENHPPRGIISAVPVVTNPGPLTADDLYRALEKMLPDPLTPQEQNEFWHQITSRPWEPKDQ